MPIQTVLGTDTRYYLIGFDKRGREREDDSNGLISDRISEHLAAEPVTDLFIISHGWKGDVPAAVDQYNRWIRAMLECSSDLARVRQERPSFNPLIVGFHWPSQPWGDEAFGGQAVSFAPVAIPPVDSLIEFYADRIADSAAAREALREIFECARDNIAPPVLPPEIVNAYQTLDRESGLGSEGEGASPGSDREPFQAERAYELARMEEQTSFGTGDLGGILAPLRQLSFWKMKARAQIVGSTGGARLIRQLQAVQGPEALRLHLMGHSFGSIVVSAMLLGEDGGAEASPVSSMFLIQGALSLWSYCEDIPFRRGTPGFFRPLLERGLIQGSLLTTRSVLDTAVGRYYPLGAGIARQVAFGPGQFPEYGAVGTFGIQGPGTNAIDLRMRTKDLAYEFQQGGVYNLEASSFIRRIEGASGAHNDITHPEVAHAFWGAVASRSTEPVAFGTFTPNTTSPQPMTGTSNGDILPEEILYVNGIDGTTGHYQVPPLELRAATEIVRDRMVPDPSRDPARAAWFERMWLTISQPNYGPPYDVRPELVEEAGWGIVFHSDERPEVRSALQPLIEHRSKHVPADRCKILEYRNGEDLGRWLARYQVSAGHMDLTCVPYYLLIIGEPSQISFGFGHQLDVEYAVGRLHFASVEDYKQYVESVITYETTGEVRTAREVVYFGTRHEFDRATQLSADHLVVPLADGIPPTDNLPGVAPVTNRAGFRVRKYVGEEATREALRGVLTRDGEDPPAVLFTATHGMGWPLGHPDQRRLQGALLCQDWPGFGNVRREHFFAADDLPAGAHVHGLIAFLFACHGGGAPSHDRFFHRPGEMPPQVADQPFLSALPQALLAHSGGGALACIAHVERAWGYSITPPRTGPQLGPFRNALGRILIGQPVGHALKDFNEKYAMLSTRLSGMLEEMDFGLGISDVELATLWIQRNDAEGYIVVGDPAVRLRTDVFRNA